jgi:hypothetical protein
MKLNSLVIFLLCGFDSFTQEWSTGATWYYTCQSFFANSVSTKFEAALDTVIEGKNCTKITQQVSFSNGRPNVEFLYFENDTVFFYDTNFVEFQVLYDFNADVGDSWNIKFKDNYPLPGDLDTIKVTVDSTDYITENSIVLKRLYVTYEMLVEAGFGDYNGIIVERFGDLNGMFNFSCYDALIVDGIYADGLRCYEDDLFGHYEAPGVNGHCAFVSALDEESSHEIEIFPNPVLDKLNISAASNLFRIYSVDGKLILEDKVNATELNLAFLNSGIYFLELTFLDNTKKCFRIIKE